VRARTARGNYGARGWTAHHGTDVWMNTAMTDRVFHGMAPQMGAWLVQSLWEHYLYNPNPAYLRRIYPLLKGAAAVRPRSPRRDRSAEWLVTSPSGSPENGFLLVDGRALLHGDPKPKTEVRNWISAGAAMDTQLLRDVFRQTIEAATTLGVDEKLRAELAAALPRLAPHQVRADGTLMEWLKPYKEFEPKHRHVSHLYAFHPSNQITRRGEPALTEAVRKTLLIRDDPAGWTGAWKIDLHARLGEAEEAIRVLHRMQTDISKHPSPKTATACPRWRATRVSRPSPPALSKCSCNPTPGESQLLPALPKAWPARLA